MKLRGATMDWRTFPARGRLQPERPPHNYCLLTGCRRFRAGRIDRGRAFLNVLNLTFLIHYECCPIRHTGRCDQDSVCRRYFRF